MTVMVSLLIFLIAALAFALSSRGLIGALTENVALLSHTSGYSRRALRVGRYYKIMAWSLLTLFLFGASVQSFLNVFINL